MIPLVKNESKWKFLDTGAKPKSTWQSLSFDDESWKVGKASFGYGYNKFIQTKLSFGNNPKSKHIVSYFRHKFTIAELEKIYFLQLQLVVDDGAVVYLNGKELVRHNMPNNSKAGHKTTASKRVSKFKAGNIATFELPVDYMKGGQNLIAVSVHQSSKDSSDCLFDLRLSASNKPAPFKLVRGPYLQSAGTDGIVIKWGTNNPIAGRVRYGLTPVELDQLVDGIRTRKHEIRIGGLKPSTKYFYSVGSSDKTLAGDDGDCFFVTSPPYGTTVKTRIWVLGDSGTANEDAKAVYNAYKSFSNNQIPDVWLMLGDNAYTNGTQREFQKAVFDMYSDYLRKVCTWSTRGNHARDAEVYYDIYANPTKGECGGFASGTEAYYSFDYSNIHFVCLDSYGTDSSRDGAMYQWLENDLQNATQNWIIAYCHHPPYTKGSHDSDNEKDSEGRMKRIRENFLPLLEAGGTDLILAGHSHVYERSFLLRGHYGNSKSFDSSMVVDFGDGRPDGDGAYSKSYEEPGFGDGSVYVVAGSSGKVTGNFKLDYPAMFIATRKLASVIIDVDGNRLDFTCLGHDGKKLDYFSILKGDVGG